MNQKRVFIIHGWGGSPDEPLHKWLKAELEKKGFEVVVPEMPDSEKPVIKAWVSKLEEIVGAPDENTILVGHSIGCQAILRYLEKLNPASKVGGVVLIAPGLILLNLEDEEEWRIAGPWLNTPIREADVIKHTPKITAIFSDNDPYVPSENIELFKKRFNAEIIIEHEKGHFNAEDGVEKLESALIAVMANRLC
ncbi:MAG: DUF1749 domain-containing protein [Candidatus Azambacteria bacterium]|nr:DUF1749 domain-containing protein [Candidatus Azambacteria bacterium]